MYLTGYLLLWFLILVCIPSMRPISTLIINPLHLQLVCCSSLILNKQASMQSNEVTLEIFRWLLLLHGPNKQVFCYISSGSFEKETTPSLLLWFGCLLFCLSLVLLLQCADLLDYLALLDTWWCMKELHGCLILSKPTYEMGKNHGCVS